MNFKIFRTFALAVSLAATGFAAAQTTVVASGSVPTIDNTWWKHAVIYECDLDLADVSVAAGGFWV